MPFDANDSSRKSGYCSDAGYCNAWMAMDNFINGPKSGIVTADADLNVYLNGDYKDSLVNMSNYIATNMTWKIGPSGVYDDTNTITQLKLLENAYTWVGDIALLTKSEYMNANTNESCLTAIDLYNNKDSCKETNYLYKNYHWWLLSPYASTSRTMFYVHSFGYCGSNSAFGNVGVRPVLYLKSNVILEGDGTIGDGAYKITGLDN